MAEFLPYLENELEAKEVDKALADGIESYLNSRKYLNKEKWLSAYNDIMTRGLTGVSLKNGLYSIQHNGANFLDSEGYYGDVAYYINKILSGLSPRKKEEEKKELPIFDNKAFLNDFGKHLAMTYYNGDVDFARSEWNNLDASDKYGIKDTKNRRNRLIEALESYNKSLLDGKYSYEGTSFGSYNGVKERLQSVIDKLKDNDPNNDNEALNLLGWNTNTWFKTGADEFVTLTDGRTIKASEWRNEDIEKLSNKSNTNNLLKLQNNNIKKIRENINKYKSLRVYSPNNLFYEYDFVKNGINNVDDLISYVKNKYANSKPEDINITNKLIGAYKILNDSNKLKNISDEHWDFLNRSKKFREDNAASKDKKYFKQLEGLDNIVFDTVSRKLYYLDSTPKKTEFDKAKEKIQKELEYKKTKLRWGTFKSFTPYNPYYRHYKQGGTIDKLIENFLKKFRYENNSKI